MSGLVQLLPPEVIDQIAAGEVIERPASVVKELVENALDAGAKLVGVDVEGGGLGRITVSDDGCGMSAEDARTALLRHATSKLRSASELSAITTLGFRGEALSSLAAVSRLTLTTRRPADDVGFRLEVEAGEVLAATATGCPAGTTVEARDLFFNTPARRKFMRSPATEQAHIAEAATRVVLGSQQAGLIVRARSRRLVDIPEGTAQQARVVAALAPRVEELFPFALVQGAVEVTGFVSGPEITRSDAKGLWFFVNGRFVRDRMLQRAVLDGYRSMLESGRYPVAVVYVGVSPSALDVNVHPQKLEVRFADSNAVFRAVSAAVTSVLARTPWLDRATGRAQAAVRRFFSGPAISWAVRESGQATYAPARASAAAQLPKPGGYFADLEPIGQVLGTFLVCQGKDEVVLIDQHAAAERVAFEYLRREAEHEGVKRQPLLFPQAIEVGPAAQALIEEHAAVLRTYGFEVDPVGPGRFAIRTVPAHLADASAASLVHDLLDELTSLEEGGLGLATRDAIARILSRCACHAVVRAGDPLSAPEMRQLLATLDDVDFGACCPHGRPVYHRLSRTELERMFHR